MLTEDEATRFLLDGLGVESLAELHEIVEALRWIAAAEDREDRGHDPDWYAGRGEFVDAARGALRLSL